MPGIVAHRSLLGGLSQRIGNPLGGALVIGREGDTDMAVVEDRIIFAISLLDMVERLGDQEGADALAGHEGKAGLDEEIGRAHVCIPVTHAHLVSGFLLDIKQAETTMTSTTINLTKTRQTN